MTTKRPTKEAPAKAGANRETHPTHTREGREAWAKKIRERSFAQRLERPEIKLLQASGQLEVVVDLLRNRRRRARIYEDIGPEPLELWIFSAVIYCLSEPDLAETMTAAERRRVAAAIRAHCDQLGELLSPFWSPERNGFLYPFQPVFDLLSLDMAVKQTQRLEGSEGVEDALAMRRAGMYILLMEDFQEVLGAITTGADWFAETTTVIKKPNDPNARRLYFLRQITKKFVSEFGTPCRSAALTLASVYFDCVDLDEASVSKLAPVIKPDPILLPAKELESLISLMESKAPRTLDRRDQEEWDNRVNELKEMLAKSSG